MVYVKGSPDYRKLASITTIKQKQMDNAHAQIRNPIMKSEITSVMDFDNVLKEYVLDKPDRRVPLTNMTKN